jgi:hypothetical protein
MALQLDHVVILVKDLEEAIKQYQKEGFKVSKGGRHDNGITENALIHFKDGTFLELLALRKRWKTHFIKLLFQIGYFKINSQSPRFGFQQRFVGKALYSLEGIMDFCLLATTGEQDFLAIKQRNINTTHLTPMQRLKPDGQLLRWKIFAPFSSYLPFVMTPYEPPFSPLPANLEHSNGIQGIEKISVCVPENEFEGAVRAYIQLLGKNPQNLTKEKALFRLERGQIEIIKKQETHSSNFSISYLL